MRNSVRIPFPFIPQNHYFILAAIASSTPSTTPKIAANKTLTSPGNKKVMVWAGYQKKESFS